MKALPDLPAGVYRHYKGQHYLVLGYGHDSNVEGRVIVVYVGLELDGAKTGPRLAARTAEDFFTPVCGLEGCPRFGEPFESDAFGGCIRCKAGSVPRFAYLGPSWTTEGESRD